MEINILGTEYELLFLSEEECSKLTAMGADGLAELYSKKLIVNKDIICDDPRVIDNINEYIKKVARHEMIHAYFHESGLDDYCNDEVLVDWLAIQLPKIFESVNKFNCSFEDFIDSKKDKPAGKDSNDVIAELPEAFDELSNKI